MSVITDTSDRVILRSKKANITHTRKQQSIYNAEMNVQAFTQ